MRTARAWMPIILLGVAGWAGATTPAPYPTMADLARVWVGASDSGVHDFYRIELDKEGKGLLTSTWSTDGPTSAYRITKTSLSKYKVEFVLVPIDAPARSVRLHGTAVSSSMVLEMSGGDWKTTIRMQSEAELQAKLKAVEERANHERSK